MSNQLTPNFHLREFKCKDGTEVPPAFIPNVLKLAEQLQILRDHLGEPIHLNSGFRTPSYNQKVGGKPASQHLTASAADITTKNKSPRELADIVEQLITEKKLKFGGLGVYPGFIHVDIRKTKARW